MTRLAIALCAFTAIGALCLTPATAQEASEAGALRAARADFLDRASTARSAQSEQLAREADAVAADIAQLRQELVAAGRARVQQERLTVAARDRLDALAAEEAASTARLTAQRGSLERILGALQRSARTNPPALAAQPQDAASAARAALLLSHAAPALDAQARELRADIDALRGLRVAVSEARDDVRAAETALAARRAEVLALIDRKQALEQELRGQAAREAAFARKLAAEARSIRELIEAWRTRDEDIAPRLKPEPAPAPTPPSATLGAGAPQIALNTAPPTTTRSFAAARGHLPPPALGRVIRVFGAPSPNALDRGVTLSTAAGAQITAPFGGTVAYADHLLDFERVLILDVGDGYYIVMVGLGEVHVRVGQTVSAAEPVGEMPPLSDGPSELYMEIRRHDQAVDPAPWLSRGWRL